jgi:hypothetical protein
VRGLHRQSTPRLDFADENTIAEAARAGRRSALSSDYQCDRHAARRRLDAGKAPCRPQLRQAAGHLPGQHHRASAGDAPLPALLDGERAIMALLSAKVGSIGDNQLGGWYSYRASRAHSICW